MWRVHKNIQIVELSPDRRELRSRRYGVDTYILENTHTLELQL